MMIGKFRVKPKFPLGSLVATPGALDEAERINASLDSMLVRHAECDWGDVPPEDKSANDDAVQSGDRILSAYTFDGVKFWIITEGDRSATTILLPSEY